MLPLLLNIVALSEYIGLSKRQCWKLVAAGELPKPIYAPGCRRALWRRNEVDEAIEKWGAKTGAARELQEAM
jgi:predicted DNA-binding transcriptional regulator AlpA